MPDFTPIQASNSGVGFPKTFTFTTTPTVGNMIVIACGGGGAGVGTITATDNQGGGNTYTQAVQAANQSNVVSAILYAIVAQASGTFTITTGGGGANGTWGVALEIPWFGAVPLIVTGSGTGAFNASPSVSTSSPTVDPDAFCISHLSIGTVGGPATVGSGYTDDYNTGSQSGSHKVIVGGTPGTQTCSWSVTGGPGISFCVAAFQDTSIKTTLRETQIAQTVVSKLATPTLRQTQIAQSVVTTTAPVVRVTQVVQTVIAVRAVPPPPDTGLGGRRGIYVPTRGVGGVEGGNGSVPFSALTNRIIVVPPQNRAIYVPPNAEGGMPTGRTITVPTASRQIYVAPNSEGNTVDGRQRTITVPIGTEGYSHR